METEQPRLPLNVLLTKRCNYHCRFCIEDTNRVSEKGLDWENFVVPINELVEAELISDLLLLGGEPLYFPGIIQLIKSLKLKPIITTNGYRLIKDKVFLHDFLAVAQNIRALNISLPHYLEDKRAKLSGTGHSFSNEELIEMTRQLAPNLRVRINTLLIRGYIDNLDEIGAMIALCERMGIEELKIGELTGRKSSIHGFIQPKTVQFNAENYISIPDEEYREKCHNEGGTIFWKQVGSVRVFFNAPPDIAMSGGKDANGNYYHRVLFEDGLIGFSWDREKDGVIDPNTLRSRA